MTDALKTINLRLNADASGIKAGMDDATQAIKSGSEQIKAATNGMTDATKQASDKMQTLQQSYRAAYKDAQRIAEVQGTQSQAFREAAKTAGEYKNKLDDVKQVTQALSSDTPVLKAMTDVTKGLAGAVGAISGAMTTFAGDNKVLQEWAQRSQGAISMLMGLEALGGLPDAFKAIGVVIKTSVIPALSELWALAMANPITAIVSVLGAAAAAFGIYKIATEDSVEATKQVATPTEDASKKIEQLTADLKAHNEQVAIQLKAKQMGVQVDAIKAKQQQEEINKNNERIKQLQDEQKAVNTALGSGKMRWQSLQDEIGALTITNYRIKEYQTELQKAADLQTKLDATKTKKNTPVEIKRASTDFAPVEQLKQIKPVIDDLKPVFGQISTMLETPKNKMSAFATDFLNHLDTMKNALQDMAVNGIGQFATMLGKSLGGANEDFGAAAGQFIASIGNVIGQGMIAIGIPMLGAVATAGEGLAMIGAGAAIIAASAAFGQMSSSAPNASGATGGSYSSGRDNYAMSSGGIVPSPNVNNMYLSGVLYGNDILISTKKSQQQYNRIK